MHVAERARMLMLKRPHVLVLMAADPCGTPQVFWGGGTVALAAAEENFHVLKCRPTDRLEDGTVSGVAGRYGMGGAWGIPGIRTASVRAQGMPAVTCPRAMSPMPPGAELRPYRLIPCVGLPAGPLPGHHLHQARPQHAGQAGRHPQGSGGSSAPFRLAS